MAIETKTVLKTYFESGDRPTQTQFANLIDSAVRDATKAIADAVENDGFTGILEIKSSTSVTSVTTGTFGLRILSSETTAAVAENIRTQLGLGALTTLVTGANDTVVSVSGGNYENRILNGRSINLTSQVTGDVFIAANSSAWSRVPVSGASTFLLSNGTATLPSFEPLIYSTTLGLSGASVSVDGLPTWPTTYEIFFRNESGSGTHDIQVGLGNASTYISAGYTGYIHSVGVVTRLFNGGFIAGVAFAASNEAEGSIRLYNPRASLDEWCFEVQSGCSDSAIMCFGNGSVDCSAKLTRLRFLPSTGTFDAGNIFIKGVR
jgi:hypothetical protein